MRSTPVIMIGLLVTFDSIVGMAQVMQLPRPAPEVTAAGAEWQLRGDPVVYAGDIYYPSGPNVFFDGLSMVMSGTYRGVPLYTDTSIELFRIVYVPIGRGAMRPYERISASEPEPASVTRIRSSLPIEPGGGELREEPRAAGPMPRIVQVESAPATARQPVGTSVGAQATAQSGRPGSLLIQSIPAPRSNAGVWLEFNGARWFSAGRAVPNRGDTFVRIGTFRGSPVYRNIRSQGSEIYVPSVADGPLAPYTRR
jgi:hypothetical protein